jgi:4-hydroxy 2-oxovalerate aldolase
MKKIEIIDCTFRDGGYYNSWFFNKQLVQRYINDLGKVGINNIEIGFRFLSEDGLKGDNAYTTDNYINSLKIPKKFNVLVMINAKDIIFDKKVSIKNLKKIFPNNYKHSRLNMVRIACHLNEITLMEVAVNFLKKQGFEVGLNLMQISEIKNQDLVSVVKKISKFKIKVFYIADSLGALNPDSTQKILEIIKKYFKGEIGIHAHNNLNLALQNTLKAFDCSVNYLDSTILGMGRGPGNTKTEELIAELNYTYKYKFKINHLVNLVGNYFKKLKENYKWGDNIFYYYSGLNSIHPTYVQTLLDDPLLQYDEIFEVINHLSNNNTKSKFNVNYFEDIFNNNFYINKNKNNFSSQKLFKDKNILLIGPGKSVLDLNKEIIQFIKSNKLLVVALNSHKSIPEKMINYRIACNFIRMIIDNKFYKNSKTPLISPISQLPTSVSDLFKSKKVMNFPMKVIKNNFSYKSNYCTIPYNLVLAYSLATVLSGSPNNIILAGFDGYDNKFNSKNLLNYKIFSLILGKLKKSNIFSITDTIYPVPKKSLSSNISLT